MNKTLKTILVSLGLCTTGAFLVFGMVGIGATLLGVGVFGLVLAPLISDNI